jgi:uroporphyrinogen decarboxylase
VKPRERVIRAIEREDPDRVPLNINIRVDVMRKLCRYLGLKDKEALLKRLGVDFRSVRINPPSGYEPRSKIPNEDAGGWEKEIYMLYDEWGIRWEATSDGKHSRITYHPLQYVNLEEYEFPSLDVPGRFDRAEREIKKWKEEYAIIGWISVGLFTHSWFLRGFREFIRDLYMNEKFVSELLDRLLQWEIEEGKRLIEAGVDICAVDDDFGMQTGMMISPSLWRKYFKPRYQKLFQELKKASDIYILFHSDGKIEQIIPDLIEIGVDILDPVQPECMDLINLKKTYGGKLTFHGTISIQKTLPFGSVEDVKNEVITRIMTIGYDGGLILAPKQLTCDVPTENILALYDTAKKYGRYPVAKLP